MCVEHEVRERATHLRSRAGEDHESGTGNFRGALEIENAERFADFPMRLRNEVEARFVAPCLFDAIRRLVFADRDRLVRHVREIELDVLQLLFDLSESRVEFFDLVADAFHRVDLRRCILFIFLQRRDFL